MSPLNKLAEFIATFFYIGKIKYCPGTFGSLAAFPLCYLIGYYSIYYPILCSVLLFIIGTFFSSIYARHKMQDDPKEVVIDEVVGQMLTIILSFPSVLLFIVPLEIIPLMGPEITPFIFLFLLPFSLFRFCDIIKPWPINWLNKNIKGGIGIMVDDVLAAVFAAILHYAIIFTLIGWFK